MNDQIATYLLSGGGVLFILFTVGRFVIRKLLKDGLEAVKDRAETDIVQHQAGRIKDLEKYLSDQTEKYFDAIKKLGEMMGEVRALTIKSEALESEVSSMRTTIASMQAQINDFILKSGQK